MRYDAVAFLEGLFREAARVVTRPGVTPADLPPEWHLMWDERAAVMEYDGGMTRERAEALALDDILGQMRAPDQNRGIYLS